MSGSFRAARNACSLTWIVHSALAAKVGHFSESHNRRCDLVTHWRPRGLFTDLDGQRDVLLEGQIKWLQHDMREISTLTFPASGVRLLRHVMAMKPCRENTPKTQPCASNQIHLKQHRRFPVQFACSGISRRFQKVFRRFSEGLNLCVSEGFQKVFRSAHTVFRRCSEGFQKVFRRSD